MLLSLLFFPSAGGVFVGVGVAVAAAVAVVAVVAVGVGDVVGVLFNPARLLPSVVKSMN